MNINKIINNVENNSDVRIFIDQYADNDECAFYIPEEKAIGINPAISDEEAYESIIHEVAHHVDISENNHPNRRDIDGEVIAHCAEYIIIDNAKVSDVIEYVEESIRDAYCFNGVVSVDEEDIIEVAERVKIIISEVKQ